MLDLSSWYTYELEIWNSQGAPDEYPIMAWVPQLGDAYVSMEAVDDNDVITGVQLPVFSSQGLPNWSCLSLSRTHTHPSHAQVLPVI